MKFTMKLKKLVCALLAFAVIIPGTFGVNSYAADNKSTTVYVSENDIHYHTEQCSCLGANKIATTVDFAVSAGFTACTKCNPPQPAVTNAAVNKSSTKTAAAAPVGTANYILNKNTKKFHYPKCSSVSDMKEKNKVYFTGTRDEAIAQGYVPCKRCNP